jgi:hypothetical protein
MPKAPKEPRKTSEYVVLVGDPTKSWAVAGTYAAATALDAMKQAVAANGGHPSEAGIEWVAVPARRPRRRDDPHDGPLRHREAG